MDKHLHFETLQLHVGQEQPDPATGARAVPIYQTSSYVFDSCRQATARFDLSEPGNIYSRLTNPTVEVLERRVAALEGGTGALAVASGAAAVCYAIMNIATNGDHVVAANNIYGGSYNLLAHTLESYGITATFVDPSCPENFRVAIKPNTKALFVETLGNPNSNVTDIEAIASVAHEAGLPLIVDNTFATPYLVRPLEYGADIVVHSATKFLGGHGSSLGGIIVDGGSFPWLEHADRFPTMAQPDPSYHGGIFAELDPKSPFVTRTRCILLRDMGAAMSPFNAFLILQGVETLSLRVERHTANAVSLARTLVEHPKVKVVNHPSLPGHPDAELYKKYFPDGGGSIFTIELRGGEEAARRFTDSLQLFSLLANVADVKSLVIHPASTTHSQLTDAEKAEQGIMPGTVRLSIGCEHVDDLRADLLQALDKA